MLRGKDGLEFGEGLRRSTVDGTQGLGRDLLFTWEWG